MRRSLADDSHTYCAREKIHCHAATARGTAFAPPWTLIPLSSTSVVASASSTSGQPGLVENRLAEIVSETSSLTTQAPGGMRARSGYTLVVCRPASSRAWKDARPTTAIAAAAISALRARGRRMKARPSAPAAHPADSASHGAAKSA